MNLNELEGKTIKTVKLSNQRVDENGSLSPFTYYWMQLVFEDGTHLSIDPYTSESSGLISTCFVDILLEQEPVDIESIINGRNCHNCKHLVSDDETDTWLRVDQKNYYCNNEHVDINPDDLKDGYLDPDCMEDYAENCMGFEENDELAIAANSKDEVAE